MPVTAYHQLTATTPDNPAYEIRPSHFNQSHLVTINAVGSEISGAFGNGGGVTFGVSADGKITASAPAAGGGLTNINVSAGTTSNLLSALTFNNANGITFGLDASTITASHNGLTSQSNQNVTAGNGGFAFQTLSFSNVNGISFGTSAGSAITASHNALTSQSNQAFSAAGGSSAFQTLSFNNANNMTFSNNGGAVEASFNAINLGVSTGGNTLGTTGTVEGAGGQYILVGGNNITLSQSTNGANSGTVTIVGPSVAISGSNGSFTANTFTFGNLNGLSFYTSNGSIVGSYTDAGGAGAGFSAGMSNIGNTAGTSGTVASQLVFVGTNGIDLSQSVNGNSATLSIMQDTTHISSAENFTWINAQSNFQQPGQSQFLYSPFQIDADLSADWWMNLRSVSIASTTFTGTTNNTTFSYQFAVTNKNILYTRLSGASSLSLESVQSSTHGLTYSVNVGIGAQTTQYTQTWGITYPVSGGTSTYSTTFGVSNASLNFSTTHLTAFTGIKGAMSNWATSMSPGQYWIAYGHSTTQTTQHTANLSGVRMQLSYGGMNLIASTIAPMGVGSNQTHAFYPFNGSGSVAGGTDISRVAATNITAFASNIMFFARMGRIV